MPNGLGEYEELFTVLTGKGREREEESFLDLMRGMERTGVKTPAGLAKGAGILREKTAGAESELAARLMGRVGEQKFATEERIGREKAATSRLRISEAGASQRLATQLAAAKEALAWEFEMKKNLMESQARKKRRAGFRQLGVSLGLGALTGGLAPSLFGATTGTGAGIGLGALMGAGGMSGLVGQKAGYGMQQQGLMAMINQMFGQQNGGSSDFLQMAKYFEQQTPPIGYGG